MNESVMAKRSSVPPPPPRRPVRRGLQVEVPATTTSPDNLSKPVGLQDLNFKVDPTLHRAFKTAAAIKGMSMRDLLEASFRCWVDQYGDDQLKKLLPQSQG